MNMRSAFGLPVPQTTCVRVPESLHFVQTLASRARISSSDSCAAMSRCVKPKSRKSASSARRSIDPLYHEIEDAIGDHELRRFLQARGRAIAVDDEDFVLVGIEADR